MSYYIVCCLQIKKADDCIGEVVEKAVAGMANGEVCSCQLAP